MLVTGGLLRGAKPTDLQSADWCFAEGAQETLTAEGRPAVGSIETVLPERDGRGVQRFRAGNTITMHKKNAQARRFALVNSVDAAVTVEGAAGTQEQIDLALAIDRPLLPLPFTGGTSRQGWQDNRDEIQAWFDIDAVTARDWESVALDALDDHGLRCLAASVKDHLMCQLKRRCFVAMPFSDAYLPLYHRAVQPAVIEAGLTPIRTDHLELIGNALNVLRQAIDSCECAVAVTTGCNPNVMYELGLVHAGGRPVVILHETDNTGALPDIPFDIRTEFVRGYRADQLDALRNELSELLRSSSRR